MSILQVVKSCPLFYELYDSEILKIVEKCKVLSFKSGDYVFKKDETGNEIFLVLSGTSQVKKGNITIAELRKGDLFGEMVLLKDVIRYADIYIDSYSDILVVEYDDIFDLYETNNKVFSILMLNLARILATRLKKVGETIMNLSTENHDLKSKVASLKSE